MLEKVKDTICRNRLLSEGERVIVGFSGGIDSSTLLHILHSLTEYNLDIWAVYINHSLRPLETPLEEKLLAEVGERLGVKTRRFTIDIPGHLKEKPESIQLLAREERYKIFESFRRQIKADKIALAHHRDDQAETVLYRIIRGTGLDGLAGIPIVRDGVFIRPLLEVSRQEIREYATSHQLQWLEDSSNEKLVYQRNKIRLQLLPLIEEAYNPRFKDGLIRLAKLAAKQRDFMEGLVKQWAPGNIVVADNRVGVRLAPLLTQPTYMQYYILKEVLLKIKPDYHLETNALERLLGKITNENYSFKTAHIFKRVSVYLENGTIFFGAENASSVIIREAEVLKAPGVSRFPALKLQFTVEPAKPPLDWANVGKDEIYAGTAKLSLPLKIRFWEPGDVFWPLGSPGAQKLHDFFINNKVPRLKRGRIPLVVTSDNRILWVTGYRMNEQFKVAPGEKEVWHIKAVPLPTQFEEGAGGRFED